MLGGVALVGAVYGAFIGRLGPEGAAALNVQTVRGAQSFVVFNTIAIVLLGWAALEGDLVPGLVKRTAPITRAFAGQPAIKAMAAGLLIGGFTLGRPLAVFREFLLYTAQPASTAYGAAAMALQSMTTASIPASLLALVLTLFGERLESWRRTSPRQAALVSAGALAAGGAFLIFYWGITRVWPALGRWGFQLGFYQ
jgi:hypothetical protein